MQFQFEFFENEKKNHKYWVGMQSMPTADLKDKPVEKTGNFCIF